MDASHFQDVISALAAAAGTIGAAIAAQRNAKLKTQEAATGGDTRLRRQLLMEHAAWDQEAAATLAANRIPFRAPPDLTGFL